LWNHWKVLRKVNFSVIQVLYLKQTA
jgi:hypothetical protein